jgi:hypothetical protein
MLGRLALAILSLAIPCLGQGANIGTNSSPSDVTFTKRIVTHDLETRSKDVPIAAVRAFIAYKTAAWLWEHGKDDTGEAELAAKRALQELLTNRSEMPPFVFDTLGVAIMNLLDRNAKETAVQLRKTHELSFSDELDSSDKSLNRTAGEKATVDSAIRSLINRSANNLDLVVLMSKLRDRQSPELARLLTAILEAEESGRSKLDVTTLLFMSENFVRSNYYDVEAVLPPIALQKRFLKVVVTRSRVAAQMTSDQAETFFNLLNGVMPEISAKAPDLLAEASVIKTILGSRVSKEMRDGQERAERIRNSADKLAATVAEAEQTNSAAIKYDLYSSAARLALGQKKFIRATELIVAATEIELQDKLSDQAKEPLLDQFVREVVTTALESKDPEAAAYATARILDRLNRAGAQRKIAEYYVSINDIANATQAVDEAIKLVSRAEPSARSTVSAISLLSIARKLDPANVSQISDLIAKLINKLPTPNPDDKPDSDHYRKYVDSVMVVNSALIRELTNLAKIDRGAAVDLANTITRREFRIAADFVLLTESLVDQPKRKTKPASRA